MLGIDSLPISWAQSFSERRVALSSTKPGWGSASGGGGVGTGSGRGCGSGAGFGFGCSVMARAGTPARVDRNGSTSRM